MLFLIILIAGFIAYLFAPWWAIILIAFAGGALLSRNGRHAFWSAGIAGGVLWGALACWNSWPNHHLLAGKIAGMFSLPGWQVLLLATVLISGFLSGLSAFAGHATKEAF